MEKLIKLSDAMDIVMWGNGLGGSIVDNICEKLEALPSADRPQNVIAQITFDEEKLREVVKEAVERFKEEYEITDRPQGEWIDCKEPPSTDRNVLIAYGTDDMKSVCIGHYEHDMKLWYEDKNFFAKLIYDAMYWCEIPQFPTRMKGADDE